MPSAVLGPVTLSGRNIRLEPLTPEHLPGLIRAAEPAEIWTYMPTALNSAEAMEAHVRGSLERQEQGGEYSFVVIENGEVVGATKYLDVTEEHKGVEIGWTWYAPAVWATTVNPEAKYLLLKHAFEDWGAIRVCLKTDARNLRSQAAIRKLGAREEGTLRNHRILPDGYRRASVYFSILDDEWPEVKRRLERRLNREPQQA